MPSFSILASANTRALFKHGLVKGLNAFKNQQKSNNNILSRGGSMLSLLSTRRGRGRGSYQSEARSGCFGSRSFGRGSGQDGGEKVDRELKELDKKIEQKEVFELKKKQDAQVQLLRQKQKSDDAAKHLQDEIQRIKSQKQPDFDRPCSFSHNGSASKRPIISSSEDEEEGGVGEEDHEDE